MTDWIRNVFLCLDWDDEDDEPVKELQIVSELQVLLFSNQAY